MLVLKVFVNTDQIDEVHVQNTGEIDEATGQHIYKIRKPIGYEDVIIYHKRELGWEFLVETTLFSLRFERDGINL